jgi:carbamoyltransferase
MQGSYLGPSFTGDEIQETAKRLALPYRQYENHDELEVEVVKRLASGAIVGWFQGRMEWGPRALGNRSILADPRSPTARHTINSMVKKREDFRPLAPAVIAEDAQQYFEMQGTSPYMLFTFPVVPRIRKTADTRTTLEERANASYSTLPAITHIDYSARVQTVDGSMNPLFFNLLQAWKRETGCSVLLNTSFNSNNEPIVCTPEDTLHSFLKLGLDCVVIGNCLFEKKI